MHTTPGWMSLILDLPELGLVEFFPRIEDESEASVQKTEQDEATERYVPT